MARFSDEEVRRYSRQLVLPEVGGIGQERLRAASLSAACEIEALYLAAAGVGSLAVPSPEIAALVRALNPAVQLTVRNSNENPCDVEGAALKAWSQIKEVLAL
jgi:adenylyltransferase/sulfurtransferase